jgi:hypothetical protein
LGARRTQLVSLIADRLNVGAQRLSTAKKQPRYWSASRIPARIKLSQKAVPHYADRLAAIFAERIRVFDCPDNLKRETALRLDSALGVFNFCGFDCQPEFFSIRISRKINADPLIWHLDSLDYHRWKNGSNMYRLRAFVSKDDLINRTDVKRKIVGNFRVHRCETRKSYWCNHHLGGTRRRFRQFCPNSRRVVARSQWIEVPICSLAKLEPHKSKRPERQLPQRRTWRGTNGVENLY